MEDLRRQEVRELARMTAHLDPAQQIFFQSEYGRHRRSPTTALLLCTLLGDFGAHYFYFGRHRAGITRLLFCWTLIPAIMALFDAHTMTARTMRYNASLANELLLAVKSAVDEAPDQAQRVIETRPQAQLRPEPRVAIAAPASLPLVHPQAASRPFVPAQPADRILMDSTWNGHEPAAAAALDEPITRDPLAPHIPLEPVAAAVAVVGGLAVAAHEFGAHTPDDVAAEHLDATSGMAQVDASAANEAHLPAEPNTDSVAGDAADVPSWPNQMARPVWPAEYDAALASELPEQAIWPVPAAMLAGESFAAAEPAPASAAPYARYAQTDEASGEAPLAGFDRNTWDPFETTSPAIAAAAAGAASVYATDLGADHQPFADPLPPLPPFPDLSPYAPEVPYSANGASPFGYPDESLRQPEQYEPVPTAEAATAQAQDQREPVFMYQVAPATRRDAVHLGPTLPSDFPAMEQPAEDDVAFPWAARMPVSSGTPQPSAAAPATDAHLGEKGAISALGSALAFGLADLLRDRSRPTRPITRPRTAETMPVYDLPQQPVAPTASPAIPPWLLDEPGTPDPIAATSAAHDSPPEWPVALETGAVVGAAGLAGAALDHAGAAHSADLAPVATPAPTSNPAFQPQPVPASIGREANAARRRVVQRVIVRKMAVLDGRVVAESTVERQVPVVPDESEMSRRIQTATLDASREALNYLLMQAPEEARPSIRQQLYDMQASLN